MNQTLPPPHHLNALHALAHAAGIAVQWRDARGRGQQVAPEVLVYLLEALDLPASTPGDVADSHTRLLGQSRRLPPLVVATQHEPIRLPVPSAEGALAFRIDLEHGGTLTGVSECSAPDTLTLPAIAQPGYHRLSLGGHDVTLAVAPTQCPPVQALIDANGGATRRPWAVAAQVYGLRRPGDAGLGDYTALAGLATAAGAEGASALAISPVHAMFTARPEHYSPYSPSSRLFLNALHIDPAQALGAPALAQAMQALNAQSRAAHLSAQALIDWPAAGGLRLALLRQLFDTYTRHPWPALEADLQAFRQAGGQALRDHACFEVLHAAHDQPGAHHNDWRHWSRALREPGNPAVRDVARQHAQAVDFHVFLQWLAARGLAGAQRAARDSGMAIGLIADLAVGTDPTGSHAWSRQQDILSRLSPGAPPDIHNPQGQSWGLTAFSPQALQRHGYGAYLEMLRASLAHAGGLRIDHALGLARTWLVPEGASPADGAFLHYPTDDLLGLIALEAHRHHAVVIGENLGTVPEGFNARIARAGMLGMSVLWFEREAGPESSDASSPTSSAPDTVPASLPDTGQDPAADFMAPHHWPAQAIATPSTHDLPTVAGWWQGRDISWRSQLQLLGATDTEDALYTARAADRQALWEALCAHDPALAPAHTAAPQAVPLDAILAFIAATPAPLVVIPLEDLLGEVEQPNLPGTRDTHPNWRRRMPAATQTLFESPEVRQRLARLAKAWSP